FSRIFAWVFFFQAEDGIRDGHVTGVQTCALPILVPATRIGEEDRIRGGTGPIEAIRARGIPDVASRADASLIPHLVDAALVEDRSEERRVGKECRSRRSPYH